LPCGLFINSEGKKDADLSFGPILQKVAGDDTKSFLMSAADIMMLLFLCLSRIVDNGNALLLPAPRAIEALSPSAISSSSLLSSAPLLSVSDNVDTRDIVVARALYTRKKSVSDRES
jgi:hypothetical protein